MDSIFLDENGASQANLIFQTEEAMVQIFRRMAFANKCHQE
jgi:hypothetical protein